MSPLSISNGRYENLKYLIREDDFLVKVDLQDAFLAVPVFQEHQKFLKFRSKGVMYQYVCLPFGLSSSLRFFTRILKPLVARLRAIGIGLIIYLDDILILAASREEAIHNLRIFVDLLLSAGFLMSW